MMTSKEKTYTLVSLLFKTELCYDSNLTKLLNLIKLTPTHSLIVAPEVCLTGFDYKNFLDAQAFTNKALPRLKAVSQDKIIILTVIEKIGSKVFNMLKVIHNGEVVYSRVKARLFKLGGEEKYFTEGDDTHFEIIEIDGIKLAVLICFELRFKDLWKICEGADVIAVPSWWGLIRSDHFMSLTKTLAIMNQCYVIASDSMNEECTKMSSIIDPQGVVTYNRNSPCLKVTYKQKEIALMRRYMDVGIG